MKSLCSVLDKVHSTRFAQQLVNNIVEAQKTGNLTQQEAPDFVVYMKCPNKNQLYAVGIEQFDATITQNKQLSKAINSPANSRAFSMICLNYHITSD